MKWIQCDLIGIAAHVTHLLELGHPALTSVLYSLACESIGDQVGPHLTATIMDECIFNSARSSTTRNRELGVD